MKGTWFPSVFLAVWGALGIRGFARELDTRDDNKDNHGADVISDVPSPEDFVRRRGHTVAVIGDYLYLDGGQLTERANGSESTTGPAYDVSTTWSIDLTASWTNETVKIRSIPKESPSLSRQTHWVDASTGSLYTWGGFTSDGSSPKQELWRLMTDGEGGGSWSQVTQRDFLAYSKLKGTFGTAFTQSTGVGYAFGGAVTHSSDGSVLKELPGYATPGLISYNFETGEWGNTSTSLYGGYGTSLNARAEYVPFGPNGLLLFLGGAETPVDATNETMVEVNWNTITMMDPVTHRWYKQTTSGNKPPTIESHCSVGIPGPNGTYEIFMYGGVSDQLRGTSSEVHVLSLPGFVFFEGPRDAPSRSDHQCAVVGKGRRQMLSQGGVDGQNRTYIAPTTADPWTYGIGILDMTELRWTDSYDPDAPDYDSPAQVKEWYEGGNLQRVNWETKELADIFAKGDPAQNATPVPPPSQAVTGTPSKGVVVGGVIAGVSCAAVAGAVAFFLIRRRKRPPPPPPRPDTSYSRRHLAPTESNQELTTQYKPEPLPKDDYQPPHFPYTPSSMHSPAISYSPSLAPTAISVEPHDFCGWRSELPAHHIGLAPGHQRGLIHPSSLVPGHTNNFVPQHQNEPLPAYQSSVAHAHSAELPCIHPRSVSEPVKTNTTITTPSTPLPTTPPTALTTSATIAYELPVPVETFRMELPDRKYSR